jgi:hypothetical protein
MMRLASRRLNRERLDETVLFTVLDRLIAFS